MISRCGSANLHHRLWFLFPTYRACRQFCTASTESSSRFAVSFARASTSRYIRWGRGLFFFFCRLARLDESPVGLTSSLASNQSRFSFAHTLILNSSTPLCLRRSGTTAWRSCWRSLGRSSTALPCRLSRSTSTSSSASSSRCTRFVGLSLIFFGGGSCGAPCAVCRVARVLWVP